MLKQFLQTCAAAALMASSAFAANTGTFSSETANGKLVVELHQMNPDVVEGTVHFADRDFHLLAMENGDQLTGHWEAGSKNIPFTSFIKGRTMTLETNGASYTLEKMGNDVPASAGTAPQAGGDVPQPTAPRIDAAPAKPRYQTREGRAFRFVVPEGWEGRESDCGVDLVSRDGITSVSHVLFFSPGQSNPDEVLQLILTQAESMKWSDVKVESSTPRNQGGQLGTTYSLSYRFNGTPVRAEVVIIVYNEAKRNVARLVVLQATPDVLNRDEKMMMELAHRIEVTHRELIDPDVRQQQEPSQDRPQDQPQAANTPTDDNSGESLYKGYEVREQKLKEMADRMDKLVRDN